MMNNSITEFENDVEKIKHHNYLLEGVKQLINRYRGAPEIRGIKRNVVEEKTFEYCSNIISLYGDFERFIEHAFSEYISCLKKIIASFDDLNNTIKDNYFENVKKLHGKLSYEKFKHLTSSSLAENLYHVIVEKKNEIYAECFLQNGGNYRPDIISKMMDAMGILNFTTEIGKYLPLRTWSEENPDEKFEGLLNGFVDRRNEIAHGATLDILGIDEFNRLIELVCAYAKSINMFLNDQLIRTYIEVKKFREFSVNHAFKKINVISLEISDFTIHPQMNLIIQQSEEKRYPEYSLEKIENINIDTDSGTVPITSDYSIFDMTLISFKLKQLVKDGLKIYFDDSPNPLLPYK